MASQHEIDSVIEATDIVALVSEYVKLEKQGKNYKGLCPFHNEDTPSFVVSPDKKIAHCFGCHMGGNPIKFLMDIEHIEFNDALAKLAKRNGITLSSYAPEKKTNDYTKFYQMMQLATRFYKKNLESTQQGLEAKEYLHKRGLDDETINMFNIGLAPKKNDALYQVLKENNYLELDMIDLGLVDTNPKGYYDLFQRRIMFPICDEAGNTIAFSGRIYNNPDKNQPKYVNSRETFLFKKKETFYNLNLAKGEIFKKKRIVLHEGQLDVIASVKSGITEAICTMGTALSIEHAQILKKYTDNVVICYDGDKAGVKASLKAIKIFKQTNFNVHLVMLPDGADPDEYVKKFGKEKYLEYFNSNIIDAEAYTFKQAIMNKNLTDSEVVKEVKLEVFSLLKQANSKTNEEHFLQLLAKELKVSYESLVSDYQGYCNINQYQKPVEIFGEEEQYFSSVNSGDIYPIEAPIIYQPKKFKSICELRLFMYAKSSREKALYIDNLINERIDALTSVNQKLWITLINSYYVNYQVFEEGTFLKLLDPELTEAYLKILEELRKCMTPYSDEDLQLCLEQLKIIQFDVKNERLNSKLGQTFEINDASELINEKFKNKRSKEKLKYTRRK